MKTQSLASLIVILLAGLGCTKDDKLRMNQIQVIGSHNSYKQAIEPPLLQILIEKNPEATGLDYHHLPLDKQLDLGIRGLEIDVSHDPEGKRYQNPRGIEWARKAGIILAPHDTAHILSQPGMKVLHVSDVDFRTSCLTFTDCLSVVHEWSKKHPTHLPLFITINTKDSGLPQPDATQVLPFTRGALDSLDAEIRLVFTEDELITPQFVRGRSETLKDAIRSNGWPTLDSVRGKIMFILDAPEAITSLYQQGKQERLMFVNVNPDDDDAGFFIVNDPIKEQEKILQLLKQGFMVRTRSDADTKEAHNHDYTRWEAAKASGAQLISTDYYVSYLSPDSVFEISFEGKRYFRCNSITSSNCMSVTE